MTSRAFVVKLFIAIMGFTSTEGFDFYQQFQSTFKRVGNETQLHYFRTGQCRFCPYISYCSNYQVTPEVGISFPSECKFCDPCFMDSLCSKYGDCCSQNSNETAMARGFCTPAILNRPRGTGFGFKMIAECPSWFKGKDIKQNCEALNANSRDLDIRKPVTDAKNLSYRNKYCAECNNVSEYTVWDTAAECNEDFPIPSSMTHTEVFDVIWDHENCSIKLVKPYFLNIGQLRECYVYDETTIISTCNVTGRWRQYDKDIEEACLKYHNVYLREYKNVYCFLCNTHEVLTPYNSDCRFDYHSLVGIFSSFSAILNFNIRKGDNQETIAPQKIKECTRGFVFDAIKMRCTEIFCPDGWWYTDGECIKAVHIDDKLEIVIKTAYRLEPPLEFTDCESSLFNIHNVGYYLRHLIYPNEIQHMGGPYQSAMLYGLTKIDFVTCRQETSNDSLPFQTVDMKMRNTLYGIKMYTNFTSNNDRAMNRINDAVFKRSLDNYDLYFANGINSTLIRDLEWTIAFQNNWGIAESTYEESRIYMEGRIHSPGRFIAFSRLLYCPYVVLNLSDVEMSLDKTILKIPYTNASVQNYNFRVINQSKVLLCADQYIINYTSTEQASVIVEPNEYTIEGILSFICTSLSALCLLTTFIIYCVFKSMRSLPGWNNMSLTITLMTAQILYQFGAGQKEDTLVCEILGLFTHYFWLVAILWMNVCCLHMFRIFGRKVVAVVDKRSDTMTYIKYLLVCVCVPIIFITTNIIVSRSTGNDSYIGYIGELCFIETRLMLGLTFALPVAVIIIINTCLFLVVVISINRQAKASAMAAVDRQYIHVYFRLSTITGMTWIFGFLYQWTVIEIFSYLFIIFNASQGVFIFVAFICNRNVWAKMRPQSLTRSSTGQGES